MTTKLTDEQINKIGQHIEDLAADPAIRDAVRSIEAKPKTTKGHYADYAQVFRAFRRDPVAMYAIPRAFKIAGADPEGVDSAVHLIKANCI